MFFLLSDHHHNQKLYKEKGEISQEEKQDNAVGERTFLTQECNKRGSMTVEAALALPLLMFFLITILQFSVMQGTSLAFLAGMHETSKEMAIYAYVKDLKDSGDDSLTGEIITGGISAAYAKSRILELAGKRGKNGTFHLYQSSVMKNEMIDLVGSYRPSHTFTIFPTQKVTVTLRARVRAWTGREGSKKEAQDEENESGEDEKTETVYVAETGKVYHKDPNCSHIRLSVSSVSRSGVGTRRNRSGGKYHACEKCGSGSGAFVYITPTGDRYHSSLECSGLKRTIHECSISEVEGMRACSRCGG